MIRAIVAVDAGNAIGWADGRLPWKIPQDMKRFKELTSGHPIIMGRKTFESFGRPEGLPNRPNIVITKQKREQVQQWSKGDRVTITHALHTALLAAKDPWIIGGGSIYEQALAMGLIEKLYITLVHTNSGGDVKFPVELYAWQLFIVQQRNLGRSWHLESVESGPNDAPIRFDYVTLCKDRV